MMFAAHGGDAEAANSMPAVCFRYCWPITSGYAVVGAAIMIELLNVCMAHNMRCAIYFSNLYRVFFQFFSLAPHGRAFQGQGRKRKIGDCKKRGKDHARVLFYFLRGRGLCFFAIYLESSTVGL